MIESLSSITIRSSFHLGMAAALLVCMGTYPVLAQSEGEAPLVAIPATAPEGQPSVPATTTSVPLDSAVPLPPEITIGTGQTLQGALTTEGNVIAGESKAEKLEKLQKVSPFKSMFYTDEEMAEIRKAINVYDRRRLGADGEDEDFLNKIGGSGAASNKSNAPAYFIYPQFFMEALAYHSPTEWSVRINHQDFTPDMLTGNNIRIVDINKESALIEWKPIEIDGVHQEWAISSDDRVEIDRGRKVVTFKLHPNQTFSSYSMRILEGRVTPMVLDINKAAAAAASKSAAEAEKSASENP